MHNKGNKSAPANDLGLNGNNRSCYTGWISMLTAYFYLKICRLRFRKIYKVVYTANILYKELPENIDF